MNTPKVSIVVPCWGVEKYLDRCVESLVNQTLKDIEIILVDDESPDRVPEMCDDWAKKDSRIKVIHKKNGGLGYARNSGLELATGEYVTFHDSDDFVDLETYETVYNVAKEKNLDVCYFKYRRFMDDGAQIEMNTDPNEYYFHGKDQVNEYMLNVVGKDYTKTGPSSVSMSSCMGIFRLSAIKSSGVLFPSERDVASEDLIFHIRMLPHMHSIGVLPKVFYNYYINSASITATFNEGKYQRMMKLLKMVKAELLQTHSWVEIKNHYYSQQLRIIKIVLKYESKSQSSIKERLFRIKRHMEEPIFEELYNDKVIKQYPRIDSAIVSLMKKRWTLPLMLIYRYVK